MKTFLALLFVLLPVFVSSKSIQKRSTVCYGSLGCFSNGGEFHKGQRIISTTPQGPDTIQTTFDLFTREHPTNARALDARTLWDMKNMWTHFRNNLPTKIIIHGFWDDIHLTSWMKSMANEFLKQGDYNVIVVDWHKGSMNLYTIATANTRVVGAQVAQLVKGLEKTFNASATSFHIIGHSLGAHTAGYAGERIPALGRITGLDPAGPYFEGLHKTVRLDPSDATFVDVIHSDAVNIFHGGFGLKEAEGHADFYPNLGHDQPGCKASPIVKLAKLGLIDGSIDVVACNHLRSIKFFIESINSKCPFMAFPCSSAKDFSDAKCTSCLHGKCSFMGLHADQNIPKTPTKYFLVTGKDKPYCEYNMGVKISFTDRSSKSSERGDLKLKVLGNKGATDMIILTKSSQTITSGDVVNFHVTVSKDIGTVKGVEFSWHHNSKLTHFWAWNLFGLRHPKLTVHKIDVNQQEAGKTVGFCADDASVETDRTITVTAKC